MTSIDDMTETEAKDALRTATRLINRLAEAHGPDDRERVMRMLTSYDGPFLPDVVAMVDAVLDERDLLRQRINHAIERLERTALRSYTVAILRGEA